MGVCLSVCLSPVNGTDQCDLQSTGSGTVPASSGNFFRIAQERHTHRPACAPASYTSRQSYIYEMYHPLIEPEPGIEQVQALADISRSVLCCHSNETRAPIANLHNSAQLEGTPYHYFKLHKGPYSSVGMQWGTKDKQTYTDGRDQHTYIVLAMPHAKCKQLGVYEMQWAQCHPRWLPVQLKEVSHTTRHS